VYETGAPPAPPPLPAELTVPADPAPDRPLPPAVSSPARQFDSPAAVLPAGPPPGTVTYRLRGTETAQAG
jgi:hypothetical protein